MFGPDHYHPSAEGYATAAMAMLPTLCAALGAVADGGRAAGRGRGEGILPVARAAAEAAAEGGTEVDGGAARGPCSSTAAGAGCRRRRPAPAREGVADG